MVSISSIEKLNLKLTLYTVSLHNFSKKYEICLQDNLGFFFYYLLD